MSSNSFGQSNSFGTPMSSEPQTPVVDEAPGRKRLPIVLAAIAGATALAALGAFVVLPIVVGSGEPSPVAGEVPNPLNPPTGCTFHPRCPHANERCRKEVPLLKLYRHAGGETQAACHGVEENRI